MTATTAPLALTHSPLHATREGWLTAAVEALAPLFAEVGVALPVVRVSCGFPGGGSARKRIGECWSTKSATDEVSNLFVSPVLGDEIEVLAVLTHELVHAADDCQHGHKAPFAKVAKALGLEGKMTATHAGAALTERLRVIANVLGSYPHGAITLGGGSKQGTRMLKVECPESGYTLRTTAKWLDAYGAPICPCCGDTMAVA